MIRLNGTTEALQVVTSTPGAGVVSLDWDTSYTDLTSTSDAPSDAAGNIASAATTTIVAAPAASVTRQVQWLSLANAGAAPVRVTVQKNTGSARQLFKAYVLPGDTIQYTSNRGFVVVDSMGREKMSNDLSLPLQTVKKPIAKPLTALLATSNRKHAAIIAGGDPGLAWAVGTPGLAGRAVDGTVDSGLIFPPPKVGNGDLYLKKSLLFGSVSSTLTVHDILWVNSGIVVTAITAQTITSVAFPARDEDGATLGRGVMLGVLVTATLGTTVGNFTVSYTNSAGVAGRTTVAVASTNSATPGEFTTLPLQAGDVGVRSIQSITISGTLTSGSISLLAYRPLDVVVAPTSIADVPDSPSYRMGTKVFPTSGISVFASQPAVTANNIVGVLEFEER